MANNNNEETSTMSEGFFDPTKPLYEAPDAAEEQPSCPAGTYGNGVGSADVVFMMISLYNPTTYKRYKTLDDAIEAGEETSQLQTWFNLVAGVNHPELGRTLVGTSPMGDYNTLISASKKGSFYPAHKANLGLNDLMKLPFNEANEALAKYEGAGLIVEVASRSWKDKTTKKQRTGSELKGVWWKS